MLKTCAICNSNIDRKDCHKNRHSEYICRACQVNGRKMTRRRQLQGLAKKTWVLVFPVIMGLSLAALASWILLKILISQNT